MRSEVVQVLREFGISFSTKSNTGRLVNQLRKFSCCEKWASLSGRVFSEDFEEEFNLELVNSFAESDETWEVEENMLLYRGDCLTILPQIPDQSIDMILCDLPYGVTNNKWDSVIDLDSLWGEYKRIIKDNGAIVLTATQPFTSRLVCSNLDMFKYELIWEKTISSGQLNVKHQPLRNHESVLVFYKKKPTYNEQKTVGTPYSINREADYKEGSYNSQKPSSKVNDGFRHAKSVVKFSNPRIKGGHPTEKPVSLLEYLIKTYTNEGDLVLDNCMGCGSTGLACRNLNRRFLGIELSSEYFAMAERKLIGDGQ